MRSLGDQTSDGGHDYTCFALPYWNWADEDPIYPMILDSGLGGNGIENRDWCIDDDRFGSGNYVTGQGQCLHRNYDYDCIFPTAPTLMELLVEEEYGSFLPLLWQKPHSTPHVCIDGDMGTMFSPDDPIFYLHHSFIDYLWALWHDANDYDIDGVPDSFTSSYSGNIDKCLTFEWLSYPSVPVSTTFDLHGQYRVSYEKGYFWDMAHVNDLGFNMNRKWFIDLYRVDSPTISDLFGLRRRRRNLLTINQYVSDLVAAQPHRYQGANQRKHKQHDEIYKSVIHEEAFSLKAYPGNRDGEKRKKAARKRVVKKWSYTVCIYEEEAESRRCGPPQWGHYENCTMMEKNPNTGDINMTMMEMLNKKGNTECMNATIRRYYDWALQHNDLQYLCLGCFDPFCHREALEGICELDATSDEAMHGTPGSSGTSNGGEHVFVEVMEQHGKGLLIFGVMTVACLVVMCIILVIIVWMTKKKRNDPPDQNGDGDGAHRVGRSDIQL